MERYGPRSEGSRLPAGEAKRLALAEDIGQLGRELLEAHFAPAAHDWLRHIPMVDRVRKVWIQNYQRVDDVVRRRSSEDLPPASRSISSPYDEQAHYGKKRSTQWVGYKVHLTETCEAHQPLLVTHVEPPSVPVTNDAMTPTIHTELGREELLLAEHWW